MKRQPDGQTSRLIDDLRKAYDRMADAREKKTIADWKIERRQHFLTLLHKEQKQDLLEIGAGNGIYAQFFQENGLHVVCTDLSPDMVRRCQQKGLIAYAMDCLNLDFPQNSFGAVYTLNCLLHIPAHHLPQVLQGIHNVLQPGGLIYWGQYGGVEQAGVWLEDSYEPKRFFSFLPDAQIQEMACRFFELLTFTRIPLDRQGFHFQELILRRR